MDFSEVHTHLDAHDISAPPWPPLSRRDASLGPPWTREKEGVFPQRSPLFLFPPVARAPWPDPRQHRFFFLPPHAISATAPVGVIVARGCLGPGLSGPRQRTSSNGRANGLPPTGGRSPDTQRAIYTSSFLISSPLVQNVGGEVQGLVQVESRVRDGS